MVKKRYAAKLIEARYLIARESSLAHRTHLKNELNRMVPNIDPCRTPDADSLQSFSFVYQTFNLCRVSVSGPLLASRCCATLLQDSIQIRILLYVYHHSLIKPLG